MASATSQDVRVRTPISSPSSTNSLAKHFERASIADEALSTTSTANATSKAKAKAACTSACCSPIASATRPALNRSAATAHSASSARSAYSTGTDGSLLQSEDGSTSMADLGDSIDAATFEQILEMDDDEDEREFSKSIVYDFFTQAENTFNSMDENLKKKDLDALSAQGHFLKGSSATLGITKLKDSCEKIQHFGARKDETGTVEEPDDKKSLKSCATTIEQAKREFKEAETALKRFYRDGA